MIACPPPKNVISDATQSRSEVKHVHWPTSLRFSNRISQFYSVTYNYILPWPHPLFWPTYFLESGSWPTTQRLMWHSAWRRVLHPGSLNYFLPRTEQRCINKNGKYRCLRFGATTEASFWICCVLLIPLPHPHQTATAFEAEGYS